MQSWEPTYTWYLEAILVPRRVVRIFGDWTVWQANAEKPLLIV